MGCRIKTNRHGYLALRLRFEGRDVHEGTDLLDTPENRKLVQDRARVIDREIRDRVFNYLRWFPRGNLAAEFEKRTSPERKRTTVAAFFDEWSEKRSAMVSAKWHAVRVSYLRTHAIRPLGRMFLDQLEPQHLLELQEDLLREGLSRASIDRVLQSALRGMLRDAEQRGYRVADLSALFSSRTIKRLDDVSTPRVEPYSNDERDRILGWFAKHRPHYHPFVFFKFWTGTRPSEAIALRWSAVDLDRQLLYIRESRVMNQTGKTKTGKSKRTVIIHDELVNLLRSLKSDETCSEDYVFTGPRGKPLIQDNFHRRIWCPALRALGIPVRASYATRHSFISYMLAAGASPLFVARQTGTSLKMIEEHYGHHRMNASDIGDLIRRGDGRGHDRHRGRD